MGLRLRWMEGVWWGVSCSENGKGMCIMNIRSWNRRMMTKESANYSNIRFITAKNSSFGAGYIT